MHESLSRPQPPIPHRGPRRAGHGTCRFDAVGRDKASASRWVQPGGIENLQSLESSRPPSQATPSAVRAAVAGRHDGLDPVDPRIHAGLRGTWGAPYPTRRARPRRVRQCHEYERRALSQQAIDLRLELRNSHVVAVEQSWRRRTMLKAHLVCRGTTSCTKRSRSGAICSGGPSGARRSTPVDSANATLPGRHISQRAGCKLARRRCVRWTCNTCNCAKPCRGDGASAC